MLPFRFLAALPSSVRRVRLVGHLALAAKVREGAHRASTRAAAVSVRLAMASAPVVALVRLAPQLALAVVAAETASAAAHAVAMVAEEAARPLPISA